ncbi:MAG: peptidylprolyl isomerase [Planctomycetia bacterium]|nr:peptidylprolyl isomerase [Planctomycetia bacterium]
MMDRPPRRSSLAILLAVFLLAQPLSAQEPAAPTIVKFPPTKTVATIDGEPVAMAEVQTVLQAIYQNQESRKTPPPAVAQALETAIDQRLVRRYILTATEGAKDEQIQEAIQRLETNLAQQKSSLEQFKQQQNLDDEGLKAQINWQLSWAKYLAQSLTDASLEACFARHRRDLDGSQLRVSHVLLRVDQPKLLEALQPTLAEAKQIRQDILDKKLTFADAAKKFSEGPSRRVGGDLGWIGRNGPMMPAFNDAAFALEKDQVSEPIITPFGVHLIQMTEEKPGDKQWSDVQEQLKQIVAKEIVEEIAKQQRANIKIEYVDDFPHFLPGTKDLAPWEGAEPISSSGAAK